MHVQFAIIWCSLFVEYLRQRPVKCLVVLHVRKITADPEITARVFKKE